MDLSTLIVDMLRKKEEEKALHAGEHGASMTPEEAAMLLKQQSTPMQPSPGMLGSGGAAKAAAVPGDRRAMIEAALASAG